VGRTKRTQSPAQASAELRKHVLALCNRDRERASSLLFQTLVELWVDAGEDEAARALYNISDVAKRAGQHQLTLKQVRALEVQLQQATTDGERERIAAAIRRLLPVVASPQARRMNAEIQKAQLAALYDHRRKAKTTVDRDKIDDRITELQTSLAEYEQQSNDAT
jgi:hypothetical protein